MRKATVTARLERIYHEFHRPAYLEMDPLGCVRSLSDPSQYEIAGLIAAGLAYGRVELIIRAVNRVFDAAGGDLRSFVLQTGLAEKKRALRQFRHRFNDGEDVALLLDAARIAIERNGSLENLFLGGIGEQAAEMRDGAGHFVRILRGIGTDLQGCSRKGFEYLIADPASGSACKRLNMYFRWMVRADDGIDLGCWPSVSPSMLIVPLDVHIVRAATELGLTSRKNADWRMAEEVTAHLRKACPGDPVRFDFSLCRYGMLKIRGK